MTLSSQRLRLVLVLAVVNVLLAAGGWLLLVGPQRQDAAKAAEQVQQTQSELTAAASAAAKAAAQKQPTFRTGELYQFAQVMPATLDEADLLLGLDQLARGAGVQVVNLSPQHPAAGTSYTTLPITLTLQGSYAKVTAFLYRLRTLVSIRHNHLVALGRLFSVTAVQLSAGATGGALTATVSLRAFAFASAASASAAPGQTGTTSTSTSTTDTTTTSG